MLVEAAEQNGGFFPVGVGHGKTVACLLLPEAMGAQTAALLVPPGMKAQLLHHDLPHLADHFRLPTVKDSDGQVYHDGGDARATLWVVAYSEISNKNRRDVLDRIAPDLVVADEAHNLRHPAAARTRRFLRFMRSSPGTRFVCMSGTLTDSSIRDYSHLIDLALGKGAPLPSPIYHRELQAWADAIDVGGEGGPGALALLAEGNETIREGYCRRLRATPGVVATTDSPYAGSLTIRKRAPSVPHGVQEALDQLASSWEWDGEVYDSTLAVSRIARQLSAGFFYRLKWPGGIVDEEWLASYRGWNRVRDQYLSHGNREDMDSPSLLEEAAERGEWTPPEWFAWQAVRDRRRPPKEAIWLSDFLAADAVAWAKVYGTGIVWVLDPPLGREIAARLGTDYFGEGADAEIAAATPGSHPILVASIRAHGTGKNLQAWSRSLVVSPPASGAGWEQLIGRTHRQGQESDEVEVHVNLHTPAYLGCWTNAREKARYIQATLGSAQKLEIARILEESI